VNYIQNMSYNVNLGYMGKYIDKHILSVFSFSLMCEVSVKGRLIYNCFMMCSQCVQNAVVEYIVNSVIMSQVDKGDLHNNQIQNVVIHNFTLCFSVLCLKS